MFKTAHVFKKSKTSKLYKACFCHLHQYKMIKITRNLYKHFENTG